MQVMTRATHDAATARMADLSTQLETVQAQIATGKRVLAPEDDPIAAARIGRIDRTLALDAASGRAVAAAISRLSATDTALDGVGAVLVRAREIALGGANATSNPADRATYTAEVAQLATQLLGLANRSDSSGIALFGGAIAAPPAYAPDVNGVVQWQGAGSAPALVLDGNPVSTGVEGPSVFAGLPTPGGHTDSFALLKQLQTALTDPDPATRTAALAQVQDGIDTAIDRTANTRAGIGARLARLDSETARIDTAKLQLGKDLEASEGLDMSTAIARLQRLSTVLSATQQSFVKVASLSLWDVVR